jgi:membrane-bound lytic murein transglycosylase B
MTTGAGVGKNTGTPFKNVMKPSRDIPPFLTLSKQLGFDPTHTAVSCPQSIGYGGAMGPSQFIPSTWAMYDDRIAAALGKKNANPWNAEDAFMATALYMMDMGASGGGYSAETEAAARYYAGGAWKTNGMGYAKSVLAYATDIQENMIDPILLAKQ